MSHPGNEQHREQWQEDANEIIEEQTKTLESVVSYFRNYDGPNVERMVIMLQRVKQAIKLVRK